uniref:Uncharacterized protein n=1 Tax=Solanum lycopersicum TaxID=4081 RepID=A0A3Q7G4B6_SOLLC
MPSFFTYLFSSETSPMFHMPPQCSIIIQLISHEDSEGYSHVPIALEHESEVEMTWLCITRAN